MIPIRLSLTGFLSYRQTAVLDFTAFDMACISGPNGAGKSSLLDAITWALFGKARRSDEGIIHVHSDSAQVTFEFEYEGVRYQVVRSKHRKRPMRLEFSRWDGRAWRPETGSSLRDTQDKLTHLLRMDYNTFVQASFFLQGQADRFAQQTPARRKETLAQILGLQVWDAYLAQARERRRRWEARIEEALAQRMHLQNEVNQAGHWQAQLDRVVERLQATRNALHDAETLLSVWQARQQELEAHRTLVEQLHRALEDTRRQAHRLEARYREKLEERAQVEKRLAHQEELEQARRRLAQVEEALHRWETLAPQARELQERRTRLLAHLAEEKARLEAELAALEREYREMQERTRGLEKLYRERDRWRKEMTQIENEWARLQDVDQRQAQAREELERLLTEMQRVRTLLDALARRREALEQEGEQGTCPVCQQPLPASRRAALLRHLEEEERSLAERANTLQAQVQRLKDRLNDLERERRRAGQVRARLEALREKGRALEERITQLEAERERWQKQRQARWAELRRLLDEEAYLPQVRRELAQIEAQLQQLGYDEAAHRQAQEEARRLRAAVEQWQHLDQDRLRLDLLSQELAQLEAEREEAQKRLQEQEAAYREAQQRLQEMENETPDLNRLRQRVLHLREEESQLLTQQGALEQRLQLLQRYRQDIQALETRLADMRQQVVYLRALEEAFGRNGVPALLIEQALPQLEIEVNRFLEKLTDGEMRVYFRTQRPYRTRKEALKETLDIVVSDRYGEREYETFSGGEAFRINFAIRLALARFLARRAGARLQFLVVDEGFGSQDQVGRQRLVEVLRSVQDEFAKILVITHLEDLKERFPVRIEVSKGPEGSRLQVVMA